MQSPASSRPPLKACVASSPSSASSASGATSSAATSYLHSPAPAFGVYVHVPFCAARCDYCAFATWTDRHHLIDDYAAACRVEIERADLAEASSVFFGGGTPSLLPPATLLAILDAIPRTAGAEVTVECNPDTVTSELFDAYRGGGVTRVSLGVQSTAAHVLASLGRTHERANVVRAVAAAKEAGFASFNVDLIFGAAGESLDDWRRTLDEVLALEPPHVSAYALTVEPGTPLARDECRHPDGDDQADKYLVADEMLGGAGLQWYEISNWAAPEHECRHNLLYWWQGDYRGIGCAAHSHERGRRWWNVRTPDRYIRATRTATSPVAASEELDAEARSIEGLQLALRTRAGVPVDSIDIDGLDDLIDVVAGRAVLTARGRLLANEVALRLRGADG